MAVKIEHNASRLKRLLREAADPVWRDGQLNYVKEPIRCLGVPTPHIRRTATVAAQEYRQAKLEFEHILAVADRLWKPAILEERALAILILGKFTRHLERRHWDHFDGWVDTLTNWAETDGLCGTILDPLIDKVPTLAKRLKRWTRGDLRWRRRAAAVALVKSARRGAHHELSFEICQRLARDRDDMVEKGIGWLLKEVSRTEPQAVADFLLDDIGRFSRTTVRYACEKLPAKLRARVMAA